MIGCEEDFEEHDAGCIYSDGNQDDPFFGLAGHEKVYIEENEG